MTIAIAPIIIKSQYLFIIYLFFHLIEDNPIPVAVFPHKVLCHLYRLFCKDSHTSSHKRL
jgi:hypothetical protein